MNTPTSLLSVSAVAGLTLLTFAATSPASTPTRVTSNRISFQTKQRVSAPGAPIMGSARTSPTSSVVTVPNIALQSINPNFRIAPGLSIGQAAFNTGVFGQALRQIPPYAFGINPFLSGFGGGFPFASPFGLGTGLYGGSALTTSPFGLGGFGTSAALAANPYALGGIGDLAANPYGGGYGGYGGYGYYEDPYAGYLRGVADVTNAQGRYLSQVQQARLLQAQADTAKLDLRRRIAEEAALERKNWFNPEVERVKDLQAAYNRATREPPITEVFSGQALNDLYNHIYPIQERGTKGPNVPIDEDMLKQINLVGSGSPGSIGVLKNHGRLNWPLVFQSPEYEAPRKRLSTLAADAVDQVQFHNPVGAASLKDMMADIKSMNETLLHNVGEVSPSEYVEAKRYLNSLESAVKALQDPNVANNLNQKPDQIHNVAELVDFMGKKGLKFAPATAGDEPAYRHLYQRFVAYDAGISSQIATSTKPKE